MSLNHVRISTRLIAAFGLIILILILMIISSSFKLSTISDESNEITDRNIVAEMAAKEISEIMQENGSRTLQLFITPNADERKIQYAAIAANKQRISEALKELNQFATSPGEKDALDKTASAQSNSKHKVAIAQSKKIADKPHDTDN